ncbi:hypothetical protein BCR34DRAFT_566954 [Clohesyomyces aquaticus]|uniref:Uncharacterized protein n=1 Tax=Clohesyomyces aquaticus TaxID=1231657 RepID=A0A1Y1ZJE6_9PLEO|nr:hypothetical protein BCR34DRAFT_566954 [Clohesyomyces aquaticus]
MIQTQLQKAEQELPNQRLQTLHELKSMVEKLSEITNICVEYTEKVKPKPAVRAFQEMEYSFEWNRFLQAVPIGPSPPAPTLLFRAARYTSQRTSYVPPAERRWSFTNYRRCHPVDGFFDAVARHLGKIRDVSHTSKNTVDEHLSSMSPSLEWALHRTGQKWEDDTKGLQMELRIYDLQALSNLSDSGVYRMSDVFQFLENQNRAHQIDAELRKWAENCDEYITIGTGIHDGFVRSIPWQDLRKLPIVSATFCRAYTLGIYRQWRDETRKYLENVGKDEVCLRVLTSAKTIAGTDQENYERVGEILRLILKPGIWFWGIKTDLVEDEVLNGCESLLKDDLIQSLLSQVSISN